MNTRACKRCTDSLAAPDIRANAPEDRANQEADTL
jgi:hypothetical protein